jgi:MFS family permease
MQMMARGYLIYELTRSATTLGVVMAAAAIPALVTGLFAGVLADRLEKKRIIQGTQFVSSLLALSIGTLILSGNISWQYLLAASVVQGTLMPMLMPARQSIVPQLVGRERLMNAVALNSMLMSSSNLLGPTLAGGLIATIGIGRAYYFMAGLNIGALYFTGRVPSLQSKDGSGIKRPTILNGLKEGFRYVGSNRTILLLLFLAFFTMILSMPIRFVLPIFAKDVFDVGPTKLGLMLSTIGIGSLGAAVIIATIGKFSRRGIILMVAGLISGGILLGFSVLSYVAPVFWLALAFLLVVGLMQSTRMTLNNSLVLEYTEEQYRGRVISLSGMGMAVMPAGVLPLTIITEYVGAPIAIGMMSLVLILITIVFLLTTQRLRKLE